MVAVEMITYNHGKFIRQAIESIMCQETNFKYCLYIWEDCSTDDTAKICLELKEKYPDKIVLNLNAQNMGVGANAKALHEAGQNSGARYIALCDGDDYWINPHKLQTQVDIMEANPELSLCSHGTYKLLDGTLTPVVNPFEDDQQWTTVDMLTKEWFTMTVSLLFRRSMMNISEKWVLETSNGDMALILMASLNGNAIHLKEPMAVYRVHSTSIMTRFNYTDIIKLITFFKKFNEYSNERFKKIIDRRLHQMYIYVIDQYYQQNKAIGPFKKAFWANIKNAAKLSKFTDLPFLFLKFHARLLYRMLVKQKEVHPDVRHHL